jgi:predicted RNA binding protein YcfA (HicA-like mRNA interferase family)
VTFRHVIGILEYHGFEFKREGKGSHRIYEGVARGQSQVVVLAYKSLGDDVKRGTLSDIIRQSGIPKKEFRS